MNRLHQPVLVPLLLALACQSAHAGSLVAPNDNAAAEGDKRQAALFDAGVETFQLVFAASQFDAIHVGDQITSVGFRLDGGAATLPPSDVTFSDYSIQLGRPSQPFPSLDKTFAANLGPDTVQVRSGPLVLAANSLLGGPGPNPFFELAFDVPYAYSGGDLLLTIRHPWPNGRDLFGRIVDAVSLPNSVGNTVSALSSNATVGDVGFFNLPITQFGFRAIPEPSGLAIFGLGMSVPLSYGWRRNHAQSRAVS